MFGLVGVGVVDGMQFGDVVGMCGVQYGDGVVDQQCVCWIEGLDCMQFVLEGDVFFGQIKFM